jgi:hypothetical protein
MGGAAVANDNLTQSSRIPYSEIDSVQAVDVGEDKALGVREYCMYCCRALGPLQPVAPYQVPHEPVEVMRRRGAHEVSMV